MSVCPPQIGLLTHHHELGRESVRGPRKQTGPDALQMIPVRICDGLLHGCSQHITAVAPIHTGRRAAVVIRKRERVQHHPIDPAARIFLSHDHTQSKQVVDQRQIEHGIDPAVRTAPLSA